MSSSSSIEWTEATWNPTRGCSRVSPGCQNCYAERFAHRLSGEGQTYAGLTRSGANGPRWTGELRLVEDAMDLPLHWHKPRMIFVNSMSDLFHERVPLEFLKRIFDVMQRASQHTFQVLTKRAERLEHLASSLEWPANVWMGVSIESDEYTFRVEHLRHVGAHVRFLSLEPLLGPLPSLTLEGIRWVIVGGESGPGARTMSPEWVRDLRDRCASSEIPFFFKQWGGVQKSRAGRILDGRTWDEFPPKTGQQAQLTLA